MIDKRKCYTMERHYCYSDFDFYRNRDDSAQVGRILFEEIADKAGVERWALVDTYTMKGKWETQHIMVLTNDNGVQIETGGYGWKRVSTEYDLAMQQKREYNEFYKQFGDIKVPDGLRRWHAEMCEMFEHDHEETLYYGEDE